MTPSNPTTADTVTVSELVKTAPHEFSANLLFDEYGLDPHFALDALVKQHDGSATVKFHESGETWVAKLYYQDSGIVMPAIENQFGTEFAVEEAREFRIAIKRHSEEDPVGKQKANFHFQPRWQGMKVENDEGEVSEFSVPDAIDEGVNVRAKGANIEFSRYLPLLRAAAIGLDFNTRYVEEPHEHSNIQDAERYVRIHKDDSGPLHSRSGPISQMAHLLETDRSGYRKLVQNDRDNHGNRLSGFYHTVTLDASRIREAFPSHKLAKEIKHYYAREARALEESHPLAHPKLGSSYQVSQSDVTLGFDEIERLNTELEETVLSTIAEVGLSLKAGDAGIYVSDAYFDAKNTERDVNLVDLSLTQIEQQQESVVLKHVADGLSAVQWESLGVAVTDGGQLSKHDIAEETGRHVGSVRRALNELPEIFELSYGDVSLKSEHIAKQVHEAVEQAKHANRRAVETTARAAEAAERGIDDSTSALMAWAANHGIELNDRVDGQLEIRAHGLDGDVSVGRAVREAFKLWTKAGMDEARFRQGRVSHPGGGYGDIWAYL